MLGTFNFNLISQFIGNVVIHWFRHRGFLHSQGTLELKWPPRILLEPYWLYTRYYGALDQPPSIRSHFSPETRFTFDTQTARYVFWKWIFNSYALAFYSQNPYSHVPNKSYIFRKSSRCSAKVSQNTIKHSNLMENIDKRPHQKYLLIRKFQRFSPRKWIVRRNFMRPTFSWTLPGISSQKMITTMKLKPF